MASALGKRQTSLCLLGCSHSHDSARNHLTQQNLPVKQLLLSLGENRKGSRGVFYLYASFVPLIHNMAAGDYSRSLWSIFMYSDLSLPSADGSGKTRGGLTLVTDSENQAPAVKLAQY